MSVYSFKTAKMFSGGKEIGTVQFFDTLPASPPPAPEAPLAIVPEPRTIHIETTFRIPQYKAKWFLESEAERWRRKGRNRAKRKRRALRGS